MEALNARLDPRTADCSQAGIADATRTWSPSEVEEQFGDAVSRPAIDLLAVPFLSAQRCSEIIRAAEGAGGFAARPGDGRFGAPELRVRQFSPQLERFLVCAVADCLSALFWAQWRVLPRYYAPPFVIRYSVDSVAGMPMHHDFQSDVSLSVVLNDDFTGGGLHFPRQGLTFFGRPGEALAFPGKVTHPHRALPVETGVRYVLTMWTRHGDEAEESQ